MKYEEKITERVVTQTDYVLTLSGGELGRLQSILANTSKPGLVAAGVTQQRAAELSAWAIDLNTALNTAIFSMNRSK